MVRLAAAAAALVVGGFPLAQQPPRDAPRDARTGTALISGVVLSDDAQPRRLRRARVTLGGAELPGPRTAITNDDGAFSFERLPAGRYTVHAAKDAYVTMHYGAARPERPGAAIALRDRETQQIVLRLPRSAVITGTITDVDGQPAAGVTVTAGSYRYVPAAGERRLGPAGAGSATTDDRGVYRIYGLAPGEYFVAALVRPTGPPVGDLVALSPEDIRRALEDVRNRQSRRSPPPPASAVAAAEPSRSVTYAPVFFPGTASMGQAVAVTVGAGEERAGVDLQLQYSPTARIEGTVASPHPGVRAVMVSVVPTDQSSGAPSFEFRSTSARPDGRFTLMGVTPGRYTLVAQAMVPRPADASAQRSAPAGMLWSAMEIAIDGQDLTDVALTLQPGLTISGRVAFEGTRPLPALSGLRVNLPVAQTGMGASRALGPIQLDADGRFTIEGIVPATYRIASAIQGVRSPIGAWWLKSIAIDGREMLDSPLDIRQSSDAAVVTFSDRASELTGAVRDAQGAAAHEYTVIAFGVRPASWFANSRRVAGVRPSADGRYTIHNLPPGEYFVIASTDVEQGEWFDPALLKRLAAEASRITLAEYERRTHDLSVR